jgi:hypothetical protein
MTKIRCINPDEIKEGDLIAYAEGDASQTVIDHILHCAYCAREVDALRTVDAQLLLAAYRNACPSAEVLADFALHRLSDPERLQVAAHVRTCEACTTELETLRDFAADEPPSLVIRLREALARAMRTQPVIAPTALARGTGWQGRFEIGPWTITLSQQGSYLVGRLRQQDNRAEDLDLGNAWLINEKTSTNMLPQSCEVDDGGRFQCELPPTGIYALLLEIAGLHITVEELEVT